MKAPPIPDEVIEAVRVATLAGDFETAKKLLLEHDPKAWKRAQWRDVTEARSQLLRDAWKAFAEDLGRERQVRREKVSPGVWAITARNEHKARVAVALVTCQAPRTINDKPSMSIEIKAPGLIGEHVRGLVARLEAAKIEQRTEARVRLREGLRGRPGVTTPLPPSPALASTSDRRASSPAA